MTRGTIAREDHDTGYPAKKKIRDARGREQVCATQAAAVPVDAFPLPAPREP